MDLAPAPQDSLTVQQANQHLRQREQQMGLALDALGGGHWEWDIRRQKLACHGRFYAAFGMDAIDTDDAWDRWHARWHPDDATRLAGTIERAMRGQLDTYEAEFRVLDTACRWRWVISRGLVGERDAAGHPLTLQGMAVDVTAQRDVEDALRASEAKYTTIYQTLPDPAGISRISDGRYLDVNPAFCELLGAERSAVVGRTSAELNIWASSQERARMLETYQREGKVDRLPMVAQRQGVRVPGLMSARPIVVDGENCLLFVFHDMTQAQRASDDLRALNDLLQQASRMARLGAWENTRGKGKGYWSEICCEIHGLSPGTPPPKDYIQQFVAPAWQETLRSKIRDCFVHQAAWSLVYKIIRADGRQAWVRAIGEPVLLDGKVIGMRGVVQDIDAAKRSEQQLRQSEDRFSRIFHLMPYPMGMTRQSDGAYVEVNPAWEQLLGFTRAQAVGSSAVKLGIFQVQERARMMEAIRQTGQINAFEVRMRTRTGEEHTALQSMLATEFDGQACWLFALQDITDRKRSEEQVREREALLQRLAHYDTLTGLPNRVLLAHRLQDCMAQARARGTRLGVAYLDLDGFKPVNDRLGHGAGDRLLVEVAGRLARALRPQDCVARLGGDEFAILLPGLASHTDGERLLQRLMDSISSPYTLDTERVAVTASIGYTMFPSDDADADTLLRHADQAMYAAKQAGRNRFHQFDAAQERARREQREQGLRLREALAQAQFVLFLQPKVLMQTGQVVGAEVLARWQHPERGLLPPGAFLPLLDGTPLEIDFGEWVVEAALAQLERLLDAGLAIPVSINISAQQLQHPGFSAWMVQCLARHPRVAPRLVELEITESAALYDLPAVAATLAELRALGVAISLDDFGTGYSSLTYLRRLPMDTLKIDQSFVRGMMADRGDRAIVQGVIGLAQSFGYQVVAEGVETKTQGQLLLQLGCAHAQGNCIAHPMPIDAFIEWASRWQPPAEWQRQNAEDYLI
ncbi:EAL domain-containing protein [Acidovorax sp. JHL-9]|uniref:sensor domain-containing protein n=1 Tax=Acidovorax sp. JHL-9 TaxID=1276756 RepID=UPI00040496EE|nr:EAL domain-containing protein [Acidovorax sp. JHL-9]